MFVTELFLQESEGKLIAIFRKGPTLDKPNGLASKIYLWKTGPGQNNFEMEVGQDRARIPVVLSLDQIRQVLAKKGFNESLTPAGKMLVEASMTKSVPGKQGSIFNRGVEKLVGQQVAIVANDHPDNVSYGLFKRIGETGLCHIKLNGGKLRNWAAGDMIAVQPNEVFAPWDSRLKDLTSIHREYDDNGEKIVREIDDLTVQNLQAKRLRDLRTQPDEVKGEIAKGKVRGMWDRVKGREALKRKMQAKQNPAPVITDSAKKK